MSIRSSLKGIGIRPAWPVRDPASSISSTLYMKKCQAHESRHYHKYHTSLKYNYGQLLAAQDCSTGLAKLGTDLMPPIPEVDRPAFSEPLLHPQHSPLLAALSDNTSLQIMIWIFIAHPTSWITQSQRQLLLGLELGCCCWEGNLWIDSCKCSKLFVLVDKILRHTKENKSLPAAVCIPA